MSSVDIARAWKDEEYRNSLPEEVRSALPGAPDNLSELSDEQLKQAAGGAVFGPVVGPAIDPIVGFPDVGLPDYKAM